MKYAFKFKKWVILVAVLLILVCATSFVLSVIRLIPSSKLHSYSVALDIANLLFALALTAFVLYALLGSGFIFRDEYLLFRFFSARQTIPYKSIYMVQYSEADSMACMFYFTDPEGGANKAIMLSFDYSKLHAFYAELKAKNPAVLLVPITKQADEND